MCCKGEFVFVIFFDEGFDDFLKEIGMVWRRFRYERTLVKIFVFVDFGFYECVMVVK